PTQPSDGDVSVKAHLTQVVSAVSSQLSDLKPGLAADTVFNEFWHWFCDFVIEETKQGRVSTACTLEGLLTFLKLLHPFMPFVTESIWQELTNRNLTQEPLLCLSSWPSGVA
ncbi:class I tRNA ligase family protein, partial [Candidatus Woesebacteria bacterium]|nr:class I tRNA ligase family protein [Candidatus Woesebacteria bacterium]